MKDRVESVHVMVCGPQQFPLVSTRVTDPAGELGKLGAWNALVKQAQAHNPELTAQGLVEAIVREGVSSVSRQVATGKLGSFLKARRR
jgi:hypothetical protein